MTLVAGTRLGSYEVLAPIGKGGMGEVWKARDTKLGRDVALKILPAAFASDPDRMARFEREARVLASLDHPNIAAIYGLEESNGVRALVLALVDGPTLAERIAAGPIPFDEAIQIARQIAEAVEYAHDRGVIHRDLKPANIKIKLGGMVKVLDFGLAKALDEEPVAGSGTNSPTLTMNATRAGVLLGTAAYMSPEQAKGKQADRRSDIWSFGVVLYEIVTGKPPFTGESVGDILASVIKEEPKLDAVPTQLRNLVARCLCKDPRQRLQAIGEARIALENPAPPAEAKATSVTRTRPWEGILAAGLALVATALGFVSYRHFTEERPRVLKVFVPPPDKATFASTSTPAVSPDGRRLAFVATSNGKDSLWIRDLDLLTARLLPGTEGASYPFWSPNSRMIAFFSEGKLKKIDVAGGPALSLCNAGPFSSGGTWNKNDLILIPSNGASGLFGVSAGGGIPTPVTTLDAASGEVSHRFPWFLPDGHHFLYTALSSDSEKSAIYVGDLDSKTRRPILAGDSNAIYVPPGYLLFLRERTLMAQPFKTGTFQTTGDAIPIAEQVDYAGGADAHSQFSASQSAGGTSVLAYTSGGSGGNVQLTWFDRSGKASGAISASGLPRWPAISPNGSMVAVDREDSTGSSDIWLHDLLRGTASRFTFNSKLNIYPIWSPDGSRINFASNRDGNFALYQKGSSGTGQDQLLDRNPDKAATAFIPLDWSKDGRFVIAETTGNPKTQSDIWVLPLFDGRKPIPYLQTEANERLARLSPNGKWLAYMSNESKRFEVYVQTFPTPGSKWQVSINGGGKPVWSRDGKELYFVGAEQKIMAVEVKGGDRFEAGVPIALFETRLSFSSNIGHFDVSKDGRFLIPTPVEQSANTAMTLVINWQAGLNK